ncbi:hypothetical protein ACFWIO_23660 [Streptomyces diastatochromogenes]|uniref:hypothetical protein n=1 Tax=Streptomyces diastatochromogenes TaxID=42236 RepID=UPI0036672B13
MLTKFWEGLGSHIAEQLVSRLFSPALVFWLCGFFAWASSQGGLINVLREQSKSWGAAPVLTQVMFLVVGLLVLVASSTAMRQAQPYLQRLLEGDWPGPLRHLGSRLARRRASRRFILEARYSELRWRRVQVLTGDQQQENAVPDQTRDLDVLAVEMAVIRSQLQRLPDPARMRPTRLGNVLQVADSRPLRKYGLEATVVWPVLWQVMTTEERYDVGQSRVGLERNTEAWGWAALFLAWTPWAWWAAPASVVASSAIYYASILSAAQTYGQLLEASFDLYRMKLYRALCLPLPASPGEERHSGALLTQFLQDSLLPHVEYQHQEPSGT